MIPLRCKLNCTNLTAGALTVSGLSNVVGMRPL